MKTHLGGLLLLALFMPAATMAQRYGRPYTLAEISDRLLLEVSVGNKDTYVRDSELRKMPRSTVTETNPTTNQKHVYEGVALDQLVPKDVNSKKEIIEIEYGSHQKEIIYANELGTGTKLMIVDTVDGKPISWYAPYDFMAEFHGKPAVTMARVYRVSVKNIPIS
jgi:hypothetical protein